MKNKSTVSKALRRTTQSKPTQKPKKLEPHPIADLFPRMTLEERRELKEDMKQRVERGQKPLEHEIEIYENKILDGRHRYEVWLELAEEGACDGFFRRNQPATKIVAKNTDTLAAWMKAKSANMVHRHIPADRKAAIFLKAVEQFPALNEVIEQIKDENSQRQKAGRRLVASDRRTTTNKAVAQMANVGETTIKAVKKLKNENPEKFEEVAKDIGEKGIEGTRQSQGRRIRGDIHNIGQLVA